MNEPTPPHGERHELKPTPSPFRLLFKNLVFQYIGQNREEIAEQIAGFACLSIVSGVLYWICSLFDTR